MSIHKSLSSKSRLKRQRNVLTRVERIAKLEVEGRWSEDKNSTFALPKVRVMKLKKGPGKKKKAEEAEEAAAGEAKKK
jgi:small basic protein (TIGR04137 family)